MPVHREDKEEFSSPVAREFHPPRHCTNTLSGHSITVKIAVAYTPWVPFAKAWARSKAEDQYNAAVIKVKADLDAWVNGQQCPPPCERIVYRQWQGPMDIECGVQAYGDTCCFVTFTMGAQVECKPPS